jgi:serine/threonine protein kinase
MSKRIIVGEGSYGCVHKPSIHCDKIPSPGFNYDDHVSKILKTKYAKKELEEFLFIHHIDPSEDYHLGNPILCKPKLDEEVIKDIKRCNNLDNFDIEKDEYSLLILKYGGPDIKALCSTYLDKYLATKKEEKINTIIFEIHNLIKGLQVFRKHNIIHYDIKPQNILFNTKTGTMKYIDFGLTKTRKEVIESSKKNENKLAIYHWSYPLDNAFLNNKEYDKYKGRNKARRNFWKKELSEIIVQDSKINTLELPITKPDTFKILFSYLDLENKVPPTNTQYGYIDSFFDGFNELIDNESKESVINKILDSIDIYGLGFSMQYLINCLQRKDYIDITVYRRLSEFFSKMYSFNPLLRITDLQQLLDEYENILLEIGVLDSLKKHFKNNLAINGSPKIYISSKSESSGKSLSKELEKYSNMDVTQFSIEVNCGKNKEWNPIKKKCTKKFKKGYVQNSEFNKNKKILSNSKGGGTKRHIRKTNK